MTFILPLQSLLGIFVLVGVAFAISEQRSKINWRFTLIALALQIGLTLLLVKVPPIAKGLLALNAVVGALQAATRAGTSFVYGFIGGGEAPFEAVAPGLTFNLAFQALPLVIVVSALSALLWHWRILPLIIRGLSFVLERTLGIGGALGLGSAANFFVGMIEAPLFVRGLIERFTRTEMMALMTVGLATVSGTVLVLYATTLEPVIPGAIGHILAASLISLPAALMFALIMVPGEARTGTHGESDPLAYHSSMDAVARGTADGLMLYLQIVAMLIVIVALVSLGNQILSILPDLFGAPVTIERIFGWLFAPLVFVIGVPWEEAGAAGSLMGSKTILNEFVGYLGLVALPEGTLSPRSELIMLYAMCGFANLGSVGMMIAAFSSLAPDRRQEIVDLGMKSLVAGTLATSMTGAFVGLVTWS